MRGVFEEQTRLIQEKDYYKEKLLQIENERIMNYPT